MSKLDLAEREWLSPQELADWLNVPLATIYQFNFEGKAPKRIKVGRSVRYRRADVEAWIASREVA